jgi:AbrB family looped-hinge helix DNA binding protein
MRTIASRRRCGHEPGVLDLFIRASIGNTLEVLPMRLTEKSQVTIPKHVRDHLGIGPGSEVDFEIDRAGARLVKRPEKETPGERMVRVLEEAGRRIPRSGLTADEIMELTRGPFDDVDTR